MQRDRIILSRALSTELQSDFIALGNRCADAFLRAEKNFTVDRARGGVLVQEKQVDAGVLARMVSDAVGADMTSAVRKRFERHVTRTLEHTINTINTMTSLGVGVSDPVQRKLIEAGGKRVGLLDLQKTTRDSLFQTINSGNQEGLGPIQIARNIREDVPAGPFVNSGPSYRSQLIARTETNWAQNTSSLAAYREADVVDSVIAMDGSDDAECSARDGTEFSFDDAEVEMENEHPNGTLSFAPVVAASAPEPTGDVSYLREPIGYNDLAAITGKVDAVSEVETAVSNIADVHRFPSAGKQVKIKVGKTVGTSFGQYNFRKQAMVIAKQSPEMTRATVYHESGHFLDNALGKTQSGSWVNVMSSSTGWPNPPSQAAVDLVKTIEKNSDLSKWGTIDREYQYYLEDSKEMFARAYAQFIATECGDKEALAVIMKSDAQWSAAKFKPISAKMKALLKDEGLL